MGDVVSIFGNEKMDMDSHCEGCRGYYESAKKTLCSFLDHKNLNDLRDSEELYKLSSIYDGVMDAREKLGPRLLHAVSDKCKDCDSPSVFSDPKFLNSLEGYVDGVLEFVEGEMDETDFYVEVSVCHSKLCELEKRGGVEERVEEGRGDVRENRDEGLMGIIESNSPCRGCKIHYEDVEEILSYFLRSNDSDYLHKLEDVYAGITEIRDELGPEILHAISDGCRSCDSPSVLLDSKFLTSLEYYVDAVKEFKRGETEESVLLGLAGMCRIGLDDLEEKVKARRDRDD